jgi:flagellar motor switch protein FliN/FliY
MTASPLSAHQTGADLARAATAAAPLVPAPHPLQPAAGPAVAPAVGVVVHAASFTGISSGEVALALDAALVEALTAGAPGIDLADVVRPALEAAASSLGPCVLDPVRAVSAADLPADVVALVGDGTPLAWLGLALRDGAVPPVPRQASPAASDPSLGGLGLNLLRDVEMTLSVEVGRARMTVRELLELAPGSVVELDRAAGAPADLLVNGRVIARGEVVVVDEDFGLRITELVPPSTPSV